MTVIFPNSQYDQRHIDGRNTDVDAAEDIWQGGGDYTFPSAVAATTIISDSAADDGSPAGTGALTVYVSGLDSNWNRATETVTMNGTNAVTLANQYLRINMAYVVTVGSGGVNAGIIDIKHGATVLARIAAGSGTISQAVYTIPNDYAYGAIIGWHCGMARTTNALADITLLVRNYNSSWRDEDYTQISQTKETERTLLVPIILNPKADIRLRVTGVSAANADIFGGFYLMLWKTENTFYSRFDTADIV